MSRRALGDNVFNVALERIAVLMEAGHRLVVSFSGGKDSGVCLELCIAAAEMTNYNELYGGLDVVMRDEEVMFPGTFEYAERMAEREELNFHWLIAGQPIINAFNRNSPYWWCFDKTIDHKLWVRQPPAIAEWIEEQNIEAMVTPERFPPAEGKGLYDVIGLRADESRGRLFGIYSSKGYLTKPRAKTGVVKCRPIYDWQDGDVWRAILDGKWDYNHAYDAMHRLGVRRKALRIAPPTMNAAGIPLLKVAQQAWPKWFDLVAERCPGTRTAAQYGLRAVTPARQHGESWEETFDREVAGEKAPPWVRGRATEARDRIVANHERHATTPLPEVKPCWQCSGDLGSWKNLATFLYLGDPFSVKVGQMLKPVEPEFFRTGAGTWGGSPAFL